MEHLIAKTNGYSLFKHLTETAEKCYEISRESTEEKEKHELSYFIGLFHDLGKAHTEIQQWFKGEIEKTPFEHGYLSALFFIGEKPIIKIVKRNNTHIGHIQTDLIKRVILHHHPIEIDKKENRIKHIDFISDEIYDLIKSLIEYTENKHNEFKFKIVLNKKSELNHNIDDDYFYKHKEDLSRKNNYDFFFYRSVLSVSDILTSNKSINLDDLIKLKFDINLIKRPQHYDDRFIEQNNLAQKMLEYKTCLFNAITGFGKTMLGVLFALYSRKKTYWVCPRNVITESVYENVVNEIKALGINISICCITGGEYKHYFNCTEKDLINGNADITVINIDSFFRPCFKTDSNLGHFSFINSTVIFDEYHEYFDDCAIMSLFDIAFYSRHNDMNNNIKTLLLSATENKYLIDVKKNKNIKIFKPSTQEELLKKKFYIKYDNEVNIDTFPNLKNSNSIIFTNSVKLSQEFKRREIVDSCVHSLFTDEDKMDKFKKIFEFHNKKTKDTRLSVSSTSIIGTGCDISFQNAYFIMTTPFNLLQQIGRINRFNECNEIPTLNFIKQIIGDNTLHKSEYKSVDICSSNEIALSFYDFLKENLKEGLHTLEEIYLIVYNFIDEFASKEFRSLKEKYNESSANHLIELNYSYSNKNLNTSDDGIKYLSEKNSLRVLNPCKIFIQSKTMNKPMQFDLNLYEFALIKNFEKNKIEIEKTYISKEIKKNKWKAKYDNLLSEAKKSNSPFIFVNDSNSLLYNEDIGLYINNSKK